LQQLILPLTVSKLAFLSRMKPTAVNFSTGTAENGVFKIQISKINFLSFLTGVLSRLILDILKL
jgi:hypothetical protein